MTYRERILESCRFCGEPVNVPTSAAWPERCPHCHTAPFSSGASVGSMEGDGFQEIVARAPDFGLSAFADRSYMFGRSRLWWFVRMVRIYRKHRVLRFNGLRRMWQDCGVAARAMKEKP